jgi:hypothetical protein
MKRVVHPASGGWGVEEARTKRMGCLLGSGFFKARGCLFFNNLEEVNHTREVVRGVAGFRLYVSLIAIEFDGDGSNTSAEVGL